jgi:subfamily B ATP-binding cassette protein MsbA
MSQEKIARKKLSFWQTLQVVWKPYRRLIAYVKPYKMRFALGLAFGFAFGAITGLLPLVLANVANFIFHGAAPNPQAIAHDSAVLNAGPKIHSQFRLIVMCLAIPAVMVARSICSYGNAYYVAWVSNKVVTDIRNQLFSHMVRHSMDFFNKMQAGFLMSRIANDTRGMQMALTTVSSDVFKQPVAIIVGIGVILMMDWKFTAVTLILFPTCILPIALYGRRARRAVASEQEDLGKMVVTMQETFSGIRVIKSFGREEHQEKSFHHSNKLQFKNAMHVIKAMEAVGPLVETIAAIGIGFALLYVYVANLSAARFFGLTSGIFILYDPIKTLSRLHIVMQRSVSATTEIFSILD